VRKPDPHTRMLEPRVLIERCGYHRRDEELRDAEAVI
jgi:hypothetical protein